MDIRANYKIILSPSFYKELRSICNYISYTLNEYIIANSLYSKIINRIQSITIFPESYPQILNTKNRNLRKLVFKQFIIVYECNTREKEILILHIFHSNQDYLNML